MINKSKCFNRKRQGKCIKKLTHFTYKALTEYNSQKQVMTIPRLLYQLYRIKSRCQIMVIKRAKKLTRIDDNCKYKLGDVTIIIVFQLHRIYNYMIYKDNTFNFALPSVEHIPWQRRHTNVLGPPIHTDQKYTKCHHFQQCSSDKGMFL